MNNLEDLQKFVRDYLEDELSKFYDFDFWKNTFAHQTLQEESNILKQWDRFGKNLKPKLVSVVSGSNEDWTPCISLWLDFQVSKDQVMVLVALLQKSKVSYVRIQSQPNLPRQFDYVKAFEHRVKFLNPLSGSEHNAN